MPACRVEAAVVGGGPAGLMAAEVMAEAGAGVTVYDRMPSVGRKFLMAGRGGLNLTHSEPFDRLLGRYGEAAPRLCAALEAFPPATLRAWSEGLGQPTFVGSSGRVFPQAMKASPLLRAWLARLRELSVRFQPRHAWQGWDDAGRLRFATPDGPAAVAAGATVLALGGASWPRLGSDGAWTDVLAAAGVAIAPLQPANCGVSVAWSAPFRTRFAGQPLKRIALSHGGMRVRGEAIITEDGLEGGAVYALSARLRQALSAAGDTCLALDLRPDMPLEALAQRLAAPRGKQSLSTFLRRRLRLPPPAIALLHEAAGGAARLSALSPEGLSHAIRATPIRVTGMGPIAKAISTAGGVAFDGVDAQFMLLRRPGVFVAGEMLDWEAPTGGYLLQGAFATGATAARGALTWLGRHECARALPLHDA